MGKDGLERAIGTVSSKNDEFEKQTIMERVLRVVYYSD